MKPITIKCHRITLRSIKESDAASFRKWLQDKEVVRHLLVQKALSLSEEIKWVKENLKSKNNFVWSMIDENKVLIGNINIVLDKKDQCVTMGIVIGEKTAWGKGYGQEAIEAVMGYAFKKLKCNRFELFIHTDNVRARRLYDKMGFVYEGTQRKKRYNLITKKFDDLGAMSILRQEYKK